MTRDHGDIEPGVDRVEAILDRFARINVVHAGAMVLTLAAVILALAATIYR